VGPKLDGSYPMRIHHVIRGGLIFVGTGIGAMSLTASAGVGSPGLTAAPAAGHVAVETVERAEAQAAPLPAAPAAEPVAVALPVAAEAAPTLDPEPEPPVVQAGPGPASPVEGATTLIDPLAIER
jgi:hypothetical protein